MEEVEVIRVKVEDATEMVAEEEISPEDEEEAIDSIKSVGVGKIKCEDKEEQAAPKILTMGQARESKERSSDVIVLGREEMIDFNDMHLSENILKGLTLCRYEKPTPIQVTAIPLGKLRKDLLLQAKSGTGKTCVFAVNILQQVVITDQYLQALILSPCREVASQIVDVLRSIGTYMQGLKVRVFIGGTDVEQSSRRSKKCHVAVGTPGRLAHLVRDEGMDLSRVKVFALDEADKLMDPVFFQDVSVILNALPENKQTISTSATYSEVVLSFLRQFMNNPQTIRLDADNLSLAAVDQYAVSVKEIIGKPSRPPRNEKEKQKFTRICKLTSKLEHSVDAVFQVKFECLKEILNRVNYTQVVIFSNFILRAESIYDQLTALNLDVCLLSSGQRQDERTAAFRGLQEGQYRILVATDLASRGIDVEGVDMVINFDMPLDSPTYIHRVGRTGRFGSFGKAMSLCCLDSDMLKLMEHQSEFKFNLFLINKLEDLNLVDVNSKISKQATLKYTQTKSLREPLVVTDVEMKNWKSSIAASMCPKNQIKMQASCKLITKDTIETIREITARAQCEFLKIWKEKGRPQEEESEEKREEQEQSDSSSEVSSVDESDVESLHESDVEYNSSDDLM